VVEIRQKYEELVKQDKNNTKAVPPRRMQRFYGFLALFAGVAVHNPTVWRCPDKPLAKV